MAFFRRLRLPTILYYRQLHTCPSWEIVYQNIRTVAAGPGGHAQDLYQSSRMRVSLMRHEGRLRLIGRNSN